MLTKLFGAAVQGIDATIVTIEVNSSRGIKFFLVGLPDSAVKESHERILSALQVNGYKFPTCQIVVNMAPADIRKEGSSYRPASCHRNTGRNRNSFIRKAEPVSPHWRAGLRRHSTTHQRSTSHCYLCPRARTGGIDSSQTKCP